MSSVALGVLFKNFYDPNFGPLNAIFDAVGLGALSQDWLGDTHLALGAVIAVVCWQNIPFYMVLFMAGLSSFPQEVNEAAHLDGASEVTIFSDEAAACRQPSAPPHSSRYRLAALFDLIT